MEIKINREIRNYTESMFFGLSMRQFIFAVIGCGMAVLLYFVLKPFFGVETLSWMCMLGAAPFIACGINAKLKMHKNANSKCTILAKHRLEEYTPLWRCEYERAKGHFREGEAFNEREF